MELVIKCSYCNTFIPFKQMETDIQEMKSHELKCKYSPDMRGCLTCKNHHPRFFNPEEEGAEHKCLKGYDCTDILNLGAACFYWDWDKEKRIIELTLKTKSF